MTPTAPDTWVDGALRGWASASEFCGLSRAQIKSLVDAGQVPCFPIGDRGDWMFSRRALAQVLEGLHAKSQAKKQEAV